MAQPFRPQLASGYFVLGIALGIDHPCPPRLWCVREQPLFPVTRLNPQAPFALLLQLPERGQRLLTPPLPARSTRTLLRMMSPLPSGLFALASLLGVEPPRSGQQGVAGGAPVAWWPMH